MRCPNQFILGFWTCNACVQPLCSLCAPALWSFCRSPWASACREGVWTPSIGLLEDLLGKSSASKTSRTTSKKKKASKSEVLANFLRRGLRQIPLDGKAQIWHRNFGCFREYRLGDYTTRTYSCPALSKLSRVVGLHALRKMHWNLLFLVYFWRGRAVDNVATWFFAPANWLVVKKHTTVLRWFLEMESLYNLWKKTRIWDFCFFHSVWDFPPSRTFSRRPKPVHPDILNLQSKPV